MKKKSIFTYDIYSVALSIYTISSWFPNRGFLGIIDTLNKDLLKYESKINGKNNISNYNDFKIFFEKISKEYKQFNPKEHFPIDNGAVKFYTNKRFYKIFIGNGNEDTYDTCFVTDSIVKDFCEYDNVWYEILEYEDRLNNFFEKFYEPTPDYSFGDFECPPEEFFFMIKDNYLSFQNTILENYFRNFVSVNNSLYDFFTKNNKYPIFLPLMKDSFLEKIEKEIAKDSLNDSIWKSFWRRLNCNFNSFFNSDANSIFNIELFEECSQKRILLKNTVGMFYKDSIIVFQNKDNVISNEIRDQILENQFIFKGLCQDGEIRNVKINPKIPYKIKFISIDCHRISSNYSKYIAFNTFSNEYIVNASSFIGIINFANDLKEIVEYFIQDEVDNRVFSFSNGLAEFNVWQESNKLINEGSTEMNLLIGSYHSVNTVFDLFNNFHCYPFDIKQSFYNIHEWKKIDVEQTSLSLILKNNKEEVHIFCFNDKKIIYKVTDLLIEDLDIKNLEVLDSFNEVILNEFDRNKEKILSSIEEDFLEIGLASNNFLKSIEKPNVKIRSLNYLKKLIVNYSEKKVLVIFSVNWNKFIENSIKFEILKFENDILLEIIDGLKFLNQNTLFNEIRKTDNNNRTTNINKVQIDYYINLLSKFKAPNKTAFKKVRKSISNIINEIGIEPGEYVETELPMIVNRFRNELRDDLVDLIKKCDKEWLHLYLLNRLSDDITEIELNFKKLQVFSTNNSLDYAKLIKYKDTTISYREEARTYKPILEYLIEENLITNRMSNISINNISIAEEIIAFGKYIFDFQLISDAYHYGAKDWFKLQIKDNFVIEISETEKFLKYSKNIRELKYEYKDYNKRDDNFDIEKLNEVKTAFKKDTKIDFDSFIDFLSVFSNNGTIVEMLEEGILVNYNNVLKGNIQDLANYFISNFNYSLENFYAILYFITLDINLINPKNVIPIWEKKKRDNKLQAKPIAVFNNDLIFSPVTLYTLKNDWFQGFMNFILPFNIGMKETTKKINEWKKHYENSIVYELGNLFDESRYVKYIDKELYKLDFKGNHPKDLGDYDLIVVDKLNLVITIFEVKFMRLSQTMKDVMGDQNEYFNGSKAKAIKFQRRVEYFENNIARICDNIGLVGKYSLKAYFLTNKNITSNFVEYPFEIISFNRFKKEFFEKK